jgi:hypothetical protein
MTRSHRANVVVLLAVRRGVLLNMMFQEVNFCGRDNLPVPSAANYAGVWGHISDASVVGALDGEVDSQLILIK